MNCSNVQDLLSAYYDGELADDFRKRIQQHLENCTECAQQLDRFDKLYDLSAELDTPPVPEGLWGKIEQQLEPKTVGEDLRATPPRRTWAKTFPVSQLMAMAAALLLVVGAGLLTHEPDSHDAHESRDAHEEFTEEFDHFLEEFQRDPAAAQRYLLAKYEHEPIDASRIVQAVGYRPVVGNGLPDGYTIESTHVMKMPCCTCIQTKCRRRDGSTLAIFEHDDEELGVWFGDRPLRSQECGGKRCSLVDLDSRIAVTWKRENRHITVIGVRDLAEVNKLVAWFENRT